MKLTPSIEQMIAEAPGQIEPRHFMRRLLEFLKNGLHLSAPALPYGADYCVLTYSGAFVSTAVYKSGGSSGTVLKTLTFANDGTNIPCNQVPFEQNGVLITRLTLGGHYEFTQTGCAIPEHTHAAETAHDTLILKGCFKLTINGAIRLVSAGDILDLPPDVPHAFMALEDGATLVNVNKQRSRHDPALTTGSCTPPQP